MYLARIQSGTRRLQIDRNAQRWIAKAAKKNTLKQIKLDLHQLKTSLALMQDQMQRLEFLLHKNIALSNGFRESTSKKPEQTSSMKKRSPNTIENVDETTGTNSGSKKELPLVQELFNFAELLKSQKLLQKLAQVRDNNQSPIEQHSQHSHENSEIPVKDTTKTHEEEKQTQKHTQQDTAGSIVWPLTMSALQVLGNFLNESITEKTPREMDDKSQVSHPQQAQETQYQRSQSQQGQKMQQSQHPLEREKHESVNSVPKSSSSSPSSSLPEAPLSSTAPHKHPSQTKYSSVPTQTQTPLEGRSRKTKKHLPKITFRSLPLEIGFWWSARGLTENQSQQDEKFYFKKVFSAGATLPSVVRFDLVADDISSISLASFDGNTVRQHTTSYNIEHPLWKFEPSQQHLIRVEMRVDEQLNVHSVFDYNLKDNIVSQALQQQYQFDSPKQFIWEVNIAEKVLSEIKT